MEPMGLVSSTYLSRHTKCQHEYVKHVYILDILQVTMMTRRKKTVSQTNKKTAQNKKKSNHHHRQQPETSSTNQRAPSSTKSATSIY